MKKRHGLAGALGACALSLTISITGCGNTETTSSETPTSEETTTQEAPVEEAGDTQEVVLPEELSVTSASTKAIALGEEPASTEGVEELPPLDDANFQDLGATDSEMEEVDPETLKGTSTRSMILTSGGITMQIPSSWMVSQDEDGFVFQDRGSNFTGYLYNVDKGDAGTSDLEQLAKSLPVNAISNGFTNVHIGSFNHYYSKKNTLCGVSITYSGDMGGKTFIFYTKLIESKSYINCIESFGEISQFAKVANEVDAAYDSVEFVTGEAI